MKVVLDTNIFVGALRSGDGINRLMLEMAFRRQITPLMGEALYREYHCLIGREGLYDDRVLNFQERQELLESLCSVCVWTEIYYKWRPNLKDEADNHLIELGLAGNAEYIVSWNIKDFKGGDLYMPDVKVVKPAELLRSLRESKN